jgi:hypothetical protein
MCRAGGDDEVVVGDLVAVEAHRAVREVDGGDFAEDHRDVGTAHDAADRRGDVARVEHRRRHLVEERLEDVVVTPIDQRDVDRRLSQPARRLEPAEPPAQHDDMRPRRFPAFHGIDSIGECSRFANTSRSSEASRVGWGPRKTTLFRGGEARASPKRQGLNDRASRSVI